MMADTNAETYRRYCDELIRFATVLVGPSDASDVVADAFVGVLSSKAWPKVRNHRAYLYQAVLNAARAASRGGHRRQLRETRAVQFAGSQLVADHVDSRSDHDALSGLSDRQKAVVYLTYWHDLVATDVAERLGISEGAVRKHLARARAQLRRQLNEWP